MKPIKCVYMNTDVEGVAGVDDWDPRHADYATEAKGVYDRAEMQRLLTGEVNAAAEGLFEAGVESILINDAHGGGRTILPEELISGVRILRGANRPATVHNIPFGCDALVMVGMHAMAYTPGACLAHTMTRGVRFRLNGTEVGEMEINAHLAGLFDVPWIFASGDSHACSEAEAWVSGITTAPVKEGLSIQCAIHLAPVDARKLIKERIQAAVAEAVDIAPLRVEGPVSLEIEYEQPGPAELKNGAERIDAFTIRFAGSTYWEAYSAFRGAPGAPLPLGE